jgi:hypothetical protein
VNLRRLLKRDDAPTGAVAGPEGGVFLPAAEWARTLDSLGPHRDRLERQLDMAEELERKGEPEAAVAIACAAAALAWTDHPGVHASPRLEAMLERIAADRLPALIRRTRSAGGPRRVLHIASELYDTGGHTRVLWRWIEREPGSIHTVVASCQVAPVPDGLIDATRRRGGDFIRLDPEAPMIERAAELRRLAAESDVVVVHQHPQDPLPTLALAAAPERPPAVMFNHADHVLWVGASISDVLLSLRSLAAQLNRGIPAERHLVRPFPVSGGDGNGRDPALPISPDERNAARSSVLGQQGWPEETVLLVTVGSPYKYEGPAGSSLRDLVEPLLDEFPDARLIAVGPADGGAWAELRERTGGRVAAVGPQPDTLPFLAAGDVYLDSRPQAGQSATAEAAACGLPALSYGGNALEAEHICPDPLYGATVLVGVEAYREALRALLGDPERRHNAGEAARAAAARADAGWADAVEEAYELAEQLGPMSAAALDPLPERPGPRDAFIAYSIRFSRDLPPAGVDRIADIVELSARSPAVRGLFWWPNGGLGYPQPRRTYAVGFAAPGGGADALGAVLDEFAKLARAGAIERFVIAMSQEDADAAGPAIRSAMAAGGFGVDLQIVDDPQSARPEGSLLVAHVPRGADPGPDTHPIASVMPP